MAKKNPLVEYLFDPEKRDRPDLISLGHGPERLVYSHFGEPGDWRTVAGFISGLRRWPVTWFPDANVAINDAAAPVWDALRVAGLAAPDGSAALSGVVEAELREWLDDPYRNKERANAIKASLDGSGWIRKFLVSPSHPLNPAMYWYTQLLGFRRGLARACPDGMTLVGTDAADKAATMNAIREKLGGRAQGLAKKGRNDADRTGFVNVSDEMHCMMVILYALTNRRNAMMLTADADHLEIFYKAQWFLDTHYRGWLAARLIRDKQYGDPVKQLEATHGYFRGPVALYRRHTAQMHEVLPPYPGSVRAGLVYVAPDDTLQKVSFPFEFPMLEMLQARSATGRSTDLFGESNIHIDLGPLSRDLDGPYLGVGRDAVIRFETNGITSDVSRLDLELSANCMERFAQIGVFGSPP